MLDRAVYEGRLRQRAAMVLDSEMVFLARKEIYLHTKTIWQ